ncbi:hypothetical protein DXD29_08250, partial [Bifidobacterium pseudocatenulatum]
ASCNVSILADMVNIGTLSAFTLVSISIPIMRKKRPDPRLVPDVAGPEPVDGEVVGGSRATASRADGR